MMEAKLFVDRRVLMVKCGRKTITVVDVSRETVNRELELAGFIPLGEWQRGVSIDSIHVRERTRFDDYTTGFARPFQRGHIR